uniref:CRAL/TRIO N-terminal domain-containing protein n=1 Tax=Timema genevievae TaxID=629358 RepID=A0A7R9PIP2_TIMGE|nr:unnamed protein product [Timema genevievae]
MPAEMKNMLSNIKELPVIELGDFKLSLELDELNSETKEIARNELRETPDIVHNSLSVLRDLLKEEADLRTPYDNDTWLIRFLRPCKFYPESAFDLIKRYYQFKVKHSNVYEDLKPSREKNVFEHNILTVLPKRDQLGRRILLLELGKKWKHNKVSLDEVFKGCVLFVEAAMVEPESQICGAVVVFDMDGLSLQQVWQFTPPFAKRIVDWLQIIFHGTDRDSLHNHLSPKCLPECYGGTLEIARITGPQWLQLLILLDKEYEVINSYGYKNKKQLKN